MGISRDSRHKRSATGAKRAYYRKKRYAYFTLIKLIDLTSAEPSRKAVNQQILVSAPNAFILSVPVVETKNTVPSVLTPATSPGAPKE